MRLIVSPILICATILMTFNVLSLACPALKAEELPEVCTIGCSQEYGETLGQSYSGVPAYSNCNSSCVVYEPNTVSGIYTGIKWQCVEYARRWLLINKGMVFGDVDLAIDIWDSIHFYTRVSDAEKIPLESFPNGSAQPPERGDLLIYAKTLFGTGHVAVVVSINIETETVEVAEQNFTNLPWSDKYSRNLELINRNGRYWLLDPFLIGWKQIAKDVDQTRAN